MTISDHVKSQFFENEEQVIRLAPSSAQIPPKTKRNGKPWSADEHNRFLEALEKYPSGPWKVIASVVGTRTTRQTMTHAQKYRERIARVRREEEQTTHVMEFTTHQNIAAAPVALPMPNQRDGIEISAREMERFDQTLLPLFQSYEPSPDSLSDAEDEIDEEFVEQCLTELVSREQQDGATFGRYFDE